MIYPIDGIFEETKTFEEKDYVEHLQVISNT